VLADPPVAVLDEATADAGSAGARELERAAEAALAGRTALVVAHRLTQAHAADRIVVMDAGRVVETGTPTGWSPRAAPTRPSGPPGPATAQPSDQAVRGSWRESARSTG
jgi:ABC-type transport system involved in cytochrome bd biosynthesis fused ATPase/permease subunit